MKQIEINSVTIENYDAENYEVVVNGTHKYVSHVFTNEDEDGNQVSWYRVVSVYNIKMKTVATSIGIQKDEFESAYWNSFIPAYKDACKKVGVEPMIGELIEEDSEKESNDAKFTADCIIDALRGLIKGLNFNQIRELKLDKFNFLEFEEMRDGSRRMLINYLGLSAYINEDTNNVVTIGPDLAMHNSMGKLFEFKKEPIVTYRPEVSMNELEELKTEYPNMIRKMRTNVIESIRGILDCIGKESVDIDIRNSEIEYIDGYCVAEDWQAVIAYGTGIRVKSTLGDMDYSYDELKIEDLLEVLRIISEIKS